MDLVYALLGWIILRLRYPNKIKRRKIFKEVYDECYITAGVEWPLKIIGVIFIIGLSAMLIVAIYRLLFFPSEL